jgi:DNA/RNA endonuclease G (NUC1)
VLGENSVAVPTHLYKVVLAEGGEKRALGVFIVPNQNIENVDLTRFQVPLEELERHTGCTFHSELERDKVTLWVTRCYSISKAVEIAPIFSGS